MFGIDFSELMVCFFVALIVLGPERLPEAVRTSSLWIGRIKRSLRETKEEIERQVGVDDIRRQLHTEEMMRTLDNMHDEIESALNYERMGSKTTQQTSAALSSSTPVTIEHDATSIDNTGANLLPTIEQTKTTA
jgi:sec-independent protein translocase protein TatB